MNFSKQVPPTPSKLPKGHMRCNQCRRTEPIRDGHWRTVSNQQIFLCKGCDRKRAEAEPGGTASSGGYRGA